MKITLNGKANVYEQIVSEYKKLIELKIIRYDEKLPSCRALAVELGINPNTIVRAYSVLENEGYIKVLPKKGVYVTYNQEKRIDSSVKEYIEHLKNNNITYEELMKIVNEIYGRK